MKPKAIALYFVHENDALRAFCDVYCRVLTAAGYDASYINLASPDGPRTLLEHLSGGQVEFCFGPQGIGSCLEAQDGVNLWEAYRIPYIGIHHDNPCHNPFNHFNASRFVANLYCFESCLEVKQRYLPGDQLSEFTPYKILAQPGPVVHNLNHRPINLAYLKSGGSLDDCNEYIDSLPPLVRDGIRQQLERAQKSPNLQLCDLADEVFGAAGIDRRAAERSFWGVVQTMDIYLRRKRAIDFVNWLKFQEKAVIIGDGWDFIDKTGARAEFKPSMSMYEVTPYYYQTRFFCNTSPYGRDIIHERVPLGLLGGACVLSDTNAWWDEHFSRVPALIRFDWGKVLDDQLQPALRNSDAMGWSATGPAAVHEHFIEGASIQPLLDLVAKVREFAAG
jgi:hypothetical protein